MSTKIESKIRKSIETNRLNPTILGERSWYNYYIRTTELIWSRNLIDGYLIEIYDEKYGNHLASLTV